MKRRKYLGLCSGILLAGCTGSEDSGQNSPTDSPTPMHTPTPSPTPTPTPWTRDALLNEMRRIITSNGVEVDELFIGDFEGGDAVLVSYFTKSETEGELSEEIGFVLGAFTGAVERGLDVNGLIGSILDNTGTSIGLWHCRIEWVRKYNKGEMTGDELSARVLLTLEAL